MDNMTIAELLEKLNNVEELVNKVDEFENTIEELKVDHLNSRIDTLEENIGESDVEDDISDHDTRLNTLEGKVHDIEESLEDFDPDDLEDIVRSEDLQNELEDYVEQREYDRFEEKTERELKALDQSVNRLEVETRDTRPEVELMRTFYRLSFLGRLRWLFTGEVV